MIRGRNYLGVRCTKLTSWLPRSSYLRASASRSLVGSRHAATGCQKHFFLFDNQIYVLLSGRGMPRPYERACFVINQKDKSYPQVNSIVPRPYKITGFGIPYERVLGYRIANHEFISPNQAKICICARILILRSRVIFQAGAVRCRYY